MKRAIFCLLLMAGPVLAHDPGLSNVTVDLGTSPILIRFTFSPEDLLVAGMSGTDDASLKEQAFKICEWRTENGPVPLRVQSSKELDKTTVEFVLDVPRVAGEFHSLLLPDMPLGHRQLLVFRDHAGESYRIQMLNARSRGEVISQRDLERTAAPLAAKSPDTRFNVMPWLIATGLMMLVCMCVLRRKPVSTGPLKASALAPTP